MSIIPFIVIILTSCFFEVECRECSSDFSNDCKSMLRHSLCRQKVLMLKAV